MRSSIAEQLAESTGRSVPKQKESSVSEKISSPRVFKEWARSSLLEDVSNAPASINTVISRAHEFRDDHPEFFSTDEEWRKFVWQFYAIQKALSEENDPRKREATIKSSLSKSGVKILRRRNSK